ncbi:hypothetical protein P7K49_003229 [Saguinus oedipus]|uniref:Uncharacterized protein n=1 Tax=Saguinus oedipus TaxID=9490 RepID=A0ABQ9WJL4_SAGOE|nr:hypothetical protein P7K49_003229 [Saguinus oedipus]
MADHSSSGVPLSLGNIVAACFQHSALQAVAPSSPSIIITITTTININITITITIITSSPSSSPSSSPLGPKLFASILQL